MAEALHEKYAPILRYARDEQFFPMSIEAFVGYCALREHGQRAPLVGPGDLRPALLARAQQHGVRAYLQSVPAELADQNVAALWSTDVLRNLVDVSRRASMWQTELARGVYDWLSAKTQAAAQLFWWNWLVLPLAESGRRSARDLPRLSLPPEIRQAALDNYRASQPARPNYTYYYRLARDDRYYCLQYWFFYPYNDWATSYDGMNDHEGDWEGLYLFFNIDPAGRLQEPPAFLTYVGHHSRLTKPWGHPDITVEGNHPVAYVAAGSHATYPERKRYELMKIYGLTDHATGDGPAIGPDDWRSRVDLSAQPWASAFLGTWGTSYWLPLDWAQRVLGTLRSLRSEAQEIGLPGVSAPRGPRYAEDGTERPNWTSTALWAGLLDLDPHGRR